MQGEEERTPSAKIPLLRGSHVPVSQGLGPLALISSPFFLFCAWEKFKATSSSQLCFLLNTTECAEKIMARRQVKVFQQTDEVIFWKDASDWIFKVAARTSSGGAAQAFYKGNNLPVRTIMMLFVCCVIFFFPGGKRRHLFVYCSCC